MRLKNAVTTEDGARHDYRVRLEGDVRRFIDNRARGNKIGAGTEIANIVRDRFLGNSLPSFTTDELRAELGRRGVKC